MKFNMSNSLASWQKPLQMSQKNMLNNWCIQFSQLKGTWKSCFYPWLQKCRISDNIKFGAQLNKDKSFPIDIVDWESYEMINTVKIQWWCLRNICFTGKQSPMLYFLMQKPQVLGDASKIWSQGMKFHPRPPWLYELCITIAILFFSNTFSPSQLAVISQTGLSPNSGILICHFLPEKTSRGWNFINLFGTKCDWGKLG